MSIRYVAAVLDHLPQLSATETLVMLALADFASDDTRECWPSVATIARRARCDRRTVQRHLRKFEEAGLLEIAKGGWHGRNVASQYRLKFDYQGRPIADVEPVQTYPQRGGTMPPQGAAPNTGGGGTGDPRGRHRAASTVIEPSLIQRGDKKSPATKKSPADRRRDAYNATDAELEQKASTGQLTAEEEEERERRRRMRPKSDGPRKVAGK